MKFGMPTLVECENLEACMALAARLSLDFVEINQSFPQYQCERLDGDALLALSQKYGVGFTFHADEQLNPFDFNSAVSKTYTQNLLETVALAKKIGASVINMHLLRGVYVTLPGKRIFLNEVYKDEFLDKVRAFADAVQAAVGTSPLKICIENTDGFLPYELEAVDILLECPCFGITLDIGHNACIGFADDGFIYPREGRLCHMHLHDSLGNKPHLVFGDGELDLQKYISLAKKCSCSTVIEVKTIDGLEKSVRYLNK